MISDTIENVTKGEPSAFWKSDLWKSKTLGSLGGDAFSLKSITLMRIRNAAAG